MRVLFLMIAVVFMLAAQAQAGEMPDFLKGRVFSTEKASCGDATGGDGLQLTREGIFGPEFGCTFLSFKEDRDADTGRLFLVVATANCGDDSGINRPDLITLSPYIEGGQVIVQSQNEYVISEVEVMIARKLGKEIPQKSEYAWVSDTYNICE